MAKEHEPKRQEEKMLEQNLDVKVSVKKALSPKDRFSIAAKEIPIHGTLFNTGWTQIFSEKIGDVNSACAENQICHHGLEHHTRVSLNALTLMDMVHDHYGGTTFTDSETLFPALTHDLGYGSPLATWEEKYARNHAEVGAEFVEEFMKNAENEESLKILKRHAKLYRQTISSDTDKMLEYVEAYQKLDANEAFPLVIMVADKLDYFRAKRVEGLTPPKKYEENPYFFLADAVHSYELTHDSQRLICSVEMKNNFNIGTKKEKRLLDFQTWCKEVQLHHGKVWKLTEAFAGLFNRRFELTEKVNMEEQQYISIFEYPEVCQPQIFLESIMDPTIWHSKDFRYCNLREPAFKHQEDGGEKNEEDENEVFKKHAAGQSGVTIFQI